MPFLRVPTEPEFTPAATKARAQLESNLQADIWSPELERLSAVPEVQQAMHAAVSGWQRSQIAQGYGAMNPGATVERGGILKFLHGKVPVFPNLQFWDYTKGALSDMISNEIRPDGSMTRKGRDLTKIERSLRFQLDSAVPQYAQARNAWSGPSSYLNAVNHGRTILSAPSEDFIGDYNSLSNVDKQGAREAAVSTIIGRIGGNPAKLADLTRILRSPEMRAKVSAIMPNAAARAAWNQKLNFEVKSSEIATAGLGNSKTARRLALEQQGLDLTDDLVANEVRHAVSEGLVSKSTRYLILGWQKMRAAMRAEIDKEMVKGLTGKPMTKAIPKPRPIRQGVPAALPYALGGISSLNTNEGRGLGQ